MVEGATSTMSTAGCLQSCARTSIQVSAGVYFGLEVMPAAASQSPALSFGGFVGTASSVFFLLLSSPFGHAVRASWETVFCRAQFPREADATAAASSFLERGTWT